MYNSIIEQPDKCYGCGACIEVCPKECLTLEYDDLGFKKVIISRPDICISCGACTNICQAKTNKYNIKDGIFERYYGQSRDAEILGRSSSGGFFSELALSVLEKGGVVWGVAMEACGDNRFICVEKEADLKKICGSKYVEVKDIIPFSTIKRQLKQGMLVLFSGTPCQVRAVASYCNKLNTDNLLLVDLLCYGVQAPLVWETYLNEINPEKKEITKIAMRNKKPGWENYSIRIDYSDGSHYEKSRWKDPYLRTYSTNYYNRPSCVNCDAKQFPRSSDITLGDFWQIDVLNKIPKDIIVARGVSVALVHSRKGKQFIQELSNVILYKIPDDVFANMKQRYSETHAMPSDRDAFLKKIESESFDKIAIDYSGKQGKKRLRFIWLRIKRLIKRVIR